MSYLRLKKINSWCIPRIWEMKNDETIFYEIDKLIYFEGPFVVFCKRDFCKYYQVIDIYEYRTKNIDLWEDLSETLTEIYLKFLETTIKQI